MSQRLNGLWIGLNLLGVYFLVTGLAEAAGAIQQWVGTEEGNELARIIRHDVYRTLTRAGVSTVGGIVLLLTADFYAPLWRDRKDTSPREPGGPPAG